MSSCRVPAARSLAFLLSLHKDSIVFIIPIAFFTSPIDLHFLFSLLKVANASSHCSKRESSVA